MSLRQTVTDAKKRISGGILSTSLIFDAVSCGIAIGGLFGVLAMFPKIDYLFGLEFLERFVASLLIIAHKAYLPLDRNAFMLVVFVLGGATMGLVAGFLLNMILAKRVPLIKRFMSVAAAASLAGSISILALWSYRDIPFGFLHIIVVLTSVLIWTACIGRAVELILRVILVRPIIPVLVAAALIIVVGTRAFMAPHRYEMVTDPQAIAAPHPLLLIGLDAASWANLSDQLKDGALPNISRLMKQGSWGELESIPGYFSPSLWTTVVTGTTPEEHGILTFSSGQVPLTSNSRTAWALWEILPKFKQQSAFHYWWASWPAEQMQGLIVTDRFQSRELDDRVFPLESTTILDAYIDSVLTDGPVIEDFLGGSTEELDSEFRERHKQKLTILQESLTRDYIVQKLGERALRRGDSDLVAVYFRTIDTVGHKFWRWDCQQTTPLLARHLYGEPDSDQELLEPVIERSQAWSDEIVGHLLAAAGSGMNVLLCSDHGMTGFRPDSSLPEPETGHHHISGVIILAGPDIRGGCVLRAASMYNVFPTILYLLDLPIPEGLKGRPLTEAIAKETLSERPIKYVATYGERTEQDTTPIESEIDEEILEKLRSLGYVAH